MTEKSGPPPPPLPEIRYPFAGNFINWLRDNEGASDPVKWAKADEYLKAADREVADLEYRLQYSMDQQ